MLYGCRLPLLIIDSVLMSALLGRRAPGTAVILTVPPIVKPPPSPAGGIVGPKRARSRLSPSDGGTWLAGRHSRTGCYRERSPVGSRPAQPSWGSPPQPTWTNLVTN